MPNQLVTINGKTFPCRQLKWKEMRAVKNCATADESNEMLYELMGFVPRHMEQLDELPVGDVYELHKQLFAAATAPTADQEKN